MKLAMDCIYITKRYASVSPVAMCDSLSAVFELLILHLCRPVSVLIYFRNIKRAECIVELYKYTGFFKTRKKCQIANVSCTSQVFLKHPKF